MTEWTDDLMAGVTDLATAETRIREVSHLADRASTELGCAKSCLSYGYADRAELKELEDAAIELMLQADKLAGRIAAMRKEVIQ